MPSKYSTAFFFLIALSPLSSSHAQSILGFTAAHAAREAAVEQNSNPSPPPTKNAASTASSPPKPHVAGSKRNNELAEYIRDEWKKQGLEDVIIRRYDVYGTNPKSASLEMIAPDALQSRPPRDPTPRRR
jgi:hypothetical protein